MSKPIVLILTSNVAQKAETRAKYMKFEVSYSDDYVETTDARYYVRVMDIKVEMDKILLPPEGIEPQSIDIQKWLEGAERMIERVKELAKYDNGVTSQPPAALAGATPVNNSPTGQGPAM